MADENKNQDPEEERNQSGNDDDFGLPDFEFEALDDDDDDAPSLSSKKEEVAEDDADEIPSMDDSDLEGLDLDNLDDIDVSDLDDIDLDNLDLDNLDDLDLGDLDAEIEESKEPEAPVAASAERDEDIFDDDQPAKKEEEIADSFGLEDDGSLYQEESYEDFDLGDIGEGENADAPSFDIGEDFESSIFDADEADGFEPDVELPEGTEDEPVPFAKRPLEMGHHHEEHEEHLSEADIKSSKGKFVRIVVLGTIMFVAIGMVFLYFYRNTEEQQDKPLAQNEQKDTSSETEADKGVDEKATENSTPESSGISNETAKESIKEPAKEPAKSTSKPTTNQQKPTSNPTNTQANNVPKQQQTKPAATRPVTSSVGGVTVLNEKTGQRHLIVASFVDSEAAQQHARSLAQRGDSPKIIPPFDGAPNYRVAIQSYGTLNEALQNLEEYRTKYGSGVWVLRY